MGPIPDDGPELVSSCADELVFDHHTDIRLVMSEIGNFGSSSDIHMIADHRVSKVGEMWYSRGLADI